MKSVPSLEKRYFAGMLQGFLSLSHLLGEDVEDCADAGLVFVDLIKISAWQWNVVLPLAHRAS
jgi:hypothetical protein